MSKIILFLLLLLGAAACKNSTAPGNPGTSSEPVQPAASEDYGNYELTPLPGTKMRRAILRNQANGKVLEQGYLDENNRKTGEWLAMYPKTGLPYKLITYEAGVQNGLYIFFNEIGQITLLATYKDNQLDGYWVKYRFGRPEEEAEYKAGKMHGTHRQYFVREGWLQFTTEYQDGIQHGMYRAYDKDGEVTLEYEFRNGEKISGGMK